MSREHHKDKYYFRAVAVMVGYIVGVGMFSLPYLTVRSGWAVFVAYFIILAFVQYFVHLIYANIIVLNNSFHRLSGYVGKYLGFPGKISVFIAKMIGGYGSLLAYLIISSIFLQQLLEAYLGDNLLVYASFVSLFSAVVAYNGIKALSKAELFMAFFLFLVVWLLAYKGAGFSAAAEIPVLDWRNLFLPYGAMLVALDGIGSLPVVGRLVKKDPVLFKSVIRTSMILSAVVMAVFVFTVINISGADTTPDALTGIGRVISGGILPLALIFGLLSILTSFIGVSEAIKETLDWDFGVNKTVSWALAVFVPYGLYAVGITDLVNVISFIGAVGGGFCAVMLLWTFLKIKKQKTKLVMFKYTPSTLLVYVLIMLFLAGMANEVSSFFK